MQPFEERIRESRSSLSPSFELIATHMLDSFAQVALLTATELAHKLDIDTGTVVRFAQHLGYRGYPELQQELRERLKRQLLHEKDIEPGTAAEVFESALSEVAHSLELTRRTFSVEAAEALIIRLDEAQRVIVLAEGLALGPARTLCSWLEAAGYTVQVSGGSLSDLAHALAGARRGDLVLAIEVEDDSPFLSRALAQAQKANMQTAALVAAASSQTAQHADLVLSVYTAARSDADQLLIEAMIFALIRILIWARPGRFGHINEQVSELRKSLEGE
jgi:DNA-binding MurR/RpiR family transcriptional regulator